MAFVYWHCGPTPAAGSVQPVQVPSGCTAPASKHVLALVSSEQLGPYPKPGALFGPEQMHEPSRCATPASEHVFELLNWHCDPTPMTGSEHPVHVSNVVSALVEMPVPMLLHSSLIIAWPMLLHSYPSVVPEQLPVRNWPSGHRLLEHALHL